jgi:hypothetical protein
VAPITHEEKSFENIQKRLKEKYGIMENKTTPERSPSPFK